MSTRDKRSSYAAIRLGSSFARASYALSQREMSAVKSSAMSATRSPVAGWDISAALSPVFREVRHAVPEGAACTAGGRMVVAFTVNGWVGGAVAVGSGG